MGRSEPKDNVPTIFTSPWMSAADSRWCSDTAALAGPPGLWAPVNSLLILLTPSKLRRTRDEKRPPLPARVTAGTPVARGVRGGVLSPFRPLRHHLALPGCPPALWPLDNGPFWGLWRAQCSHLTPGLTPCLEWGGVGDPGAVGGAAHVWGLWQTLALWWRINRFQFDSTIRNIFYIYIFSIFNLVYCFVFVFLLKTSLIEQKKFLIRLTKVHAAYDQQRNRK